MTTHRTIDPYTFFNHAALNHQPKASFKGKTKTQFAAWQKQTLPKVLETLGDLPKKVSPKAELLAEWREDGLIKQRWVINTQPGLSAILLLYRPDNLKRGEKRPAILCCHGHGSHGKFPVMGIDIANNPKDLTNENYPYGLEMAKTGFVTYAIDWFGFGERSSRNKPHYHGEAIGNRDECNINYLCATMLGTTPLAINTHDGSAVTDWICQQKFVDGDNLGVMGLSQGGTMTTWMAITDPRFKAVDVICYGSPFYDFLYRAYNGCGSQVAPSLYKLVDVCDLQGLIAPRPLLIEIGIHDSCFHVDESFNTHYKSLEKIYAAAGATDKLELDLFPGHHQWADIKSRDFFAKHLNANWM